MIRFRLGRGGMVVLVVKSANCSVLGQKRVRGSRGPNRVRFNGRLHGRPLAPGRYTIDLVVVRGSTRTQFGAIAVEVVPPGFHLTKAQQSAPLVDGCASRGSATALPVPLASTSGPPPAVSADATSKPDKRTGVLGVSLRPPRLPLPLLGLEGGGSTWFGLLLYLPLVLGLATITFYVMRFLRGSWNP